MKILLDVYVKQFLNGNETAFEKLYNETKKSVFLAIYSYLKDKDLTQDLMQETYMKALNSLNSYHLGTNFNAWIVKIARNKTLDYLRANKKVSYNDELIAVIPDQNNIPTYLDSVIKKLDPELRMVFIYHSLMDFSFKRIGEILEMDLKHVAYLYKKAITILRDELEDIK